MDQQPYPYGDQYIKRVRLAGQGFAGATLDTSYWTFSNTGTGASSQANAVNTLSNGATANSQARIVSNKSGLFSSISDNIFHGHFRIPQLYANNVRQFGVVLLATGNPNNGFSFIANGLTFGIAKYRAGVQTIVTQENFNTRKFSLDYNRHEYEIKWTNDTVSFFIDDLCVHTEKAGTTLLAGAFQLPIFIDNTNSGGSTTNTTLECSGVAIYRLGDIESMGIYTNITAAGTYTLKTNAGLLKAIMVNSTSGTSCVIYDNTSGTGTKIGTIALNAILSWLPNGGVNFTNGLTLVTTGTSMDVTVIWE